MGGRAGARVRKPVVCDSARGARRVRATPRPPHEDGGGEGGAADRPSPIGASSARLFKSARYGGIAIKSRRAQARDERAAAELKRARERPLGVKARHRAVTAALSSAARGRRRRRIWQRRGGQLLRRCGGGGGLCLGRRAGALGAARGGGGRSVRPVPRRADRRASCPPKRGAARGRFARRASHARPATRAARMTTSRTWEHVTPSTRRVLRSTGSRPPASRPTPTARATTASTCRAVRTRATDAGSLRLAHAMHGAACRSSRTRLWESP